MYANYRHSFRTPTIGQLFRSGSSTNTTDLKPIQAESIELGLKGKLHTANYSIALYRMEIKDDIVSYIDNASNDRKVTNAGKTLHQGIEVGFSKRMSSEWSVSSALSYSKHTYEDFTALVGFPAQAINYEGNRVAKAPRSLANLSVTYFPSWLADLSIETELDHIGHYYTDETNTQSYNGHNIINLRTHYAIDDQCMLSARVTNLANKRYSTYTSNRVGSDDIQYRPGLPRAVYVQLEASF